MNKDWIKRSYRTFFQTFMATVLVGINSIDFTSNKEVLKGTLLTVLVSSIAAGISAIMNIKK